MVRAAKKDKFSYFKNDEDALSSRLSTFGIDEIARGRLLLEVERRVVD